MVDVNRERQSTMVAPCSFVYQPQDSVEGRIGYEQCDKRFTQSAKRILYSFYNRSRLSDRIDLLLGRRDSLIPPWRIIHDGTTSLDHFKSQIPVYLKEVRQFGLKPSDKVLDVGCGNGKLGIVLTKYLTAEGSYDGFDIVATAINWCSENITPKCPNFRFRHADVPIHTTTG